MVGALVRDLHGEQVAAALHDNLGDAPSRNAAAAVDARAGDGHLLAALVGGAEVAGAAKDPKDAGAELGQAPQDVGALGAVKGERDAGVEVGVGRGVELGDLGEIDPGAVGLVVGPQRAEEGKELLVPASGQRDLTFFSSPGLSSRQRGRRHRPQPVLDPGVEHARVPGLVERAAAEGIGGSLARGPDFATEGGATGRGDARTFSLEGEAGDGGIEGNQGGNEARMEQR